MIFKAFIEYYTIKNASNHTYDNSLEESDILNNSSFDFSYDQENVTYTTFNLTALEKHVKIEFEIFNNGCVHFLDNMNFRSFYSSSMSSELCGRFCLNTSSKFLFINQKYISVFF